MARSTLFLHVPCFIEVSYMLFAIKNMSFVKCRSHFNRITQHDDEFSIWRVIEDVLQCMLRM